MENLWYEVGNLCLTMAKALLENSKRPITETADVVQKLVDTAIAMDRLNLDWEMAKSQTFGILARTATPKGGENHENRNPSGRAAAHLRLRERD